MDKDSAENEFISLRGKQKINWRFPYEYSILSLLQNETSHLFVL